LAVELNKNFYLGAENIRDNGHGNVIHGAELVPSQTVLVGQVDGRNEDDCGLLKSRMLAYGTRQLEVVHARHADISENDRDIVLQQLSQGFLPGARLDEVLSQFAEHRFVRKQLCRLVIDQQDVDPVIHSHSASLRAVTETEPSLPRPAQTKQLPLLSGLARWLYPARPPPDLLFFLQV